jgi:GNAT superfamily N-acetyltransferase
MDWYIEQVFAARTWKLRKEVLSPTGKLADVMLEGDFEATHFAAYHDIDVVGVLTLIRSANTFTIHFFAVHQAFRKRGIGTALLRYAQHFVKTINGNCLLAHVTREQCYFWTKNGFMEVGEDNGFITFSLAL